MAGKGRILIPFRNGNIRTVAKVCNGRAISHKLENSNPSKYRKSRRGKWWAILDSNQ